MPTTAKRRPIHEAMATLGRQRNYPRWFANTRYLERAGFEPGAWIDLQPANGRLIVTPAETETGKRVQEKGGLPLIDLNQKLLEEVFGSAERIHVRVEERRIILSLDPIGREAAESRPRDGSVGSVFAGAGLFDEAAREAGLTPRWAIEIDRRTADVFAENHPEATVYEMGVEEAIFSDLEPVEVMTIGLPCQPWSRVRTTKGNRGTKVDRTRAVTEHPLGFCAMPTFMLIAKLQPRTVVLENVPGFATSETAAMLAGALRKIGYHVETRVLNAADYGAMTRRRRAVMVAQTPEDDGTVPDAWPMERAPDTRLGDVLDRDVGADAWWDRESHPNRFRRNAANKAKGRGFTFQVTHPDDVSVPAITAEYGNCKIDVPLVPHPDRPDTYRWFTLAEGKRIMGLTDEYVLPEAKGPGFRLLGQAVVVPLFREVIGRATGRIEALRRQVTDAVPGAQLQLAADG